ncbi:MAG TPA: sigma 54-interacting transcriptional regulator [bacterium]|nr:sigma 54-interacting transcriptional regulator [bacterium]
MAQTEPFRASQLLADRYEVIARLGGGETAETYKVRDAIGDRLLALKILREDAPKTEERSLSREFYYLSRFTHPNIVSAFDYGSTPEGRPFFTMEFFDGRPITAFFATGFQPGLVDVSLQVLAALDRIHAQGLIHSDLKPQNLLVADIDGSPRAKLLDFGLAERLSLSDTSVPRGTLGYVAPEVLKGVDADARADLYSLGLVLYEVVTGRGPGKERDLLAWLRMQYYSEFKAPREFNQSIPEDFESVLLSLVHKEPERRPRSAAAVIEVLSRPGGEPLGLAEPQGYTAAPGFLGRSDELAGLKAMLDDTSRGTARAACITGERGVGKSRLLSEFRFMAQLDGATIVSFEPSSLGGGSRSLVGMTLDYLSARSPVGGPDAGESRAATTEEKYRLFDTLVGGLKEMSSSPRVRHSLVLIVDDFELYDSTSLEFLRYLVFSLGNERLMVLVAGVNEARLLDLVAGLGPASSFRHMALPPMGEKEVTALLASLVGELPGSERLTQWLMHATGGSPLFVIETVRSLIDGNVLVRRGSRWALVEDALSASSAPSSVTDVLQKRLEALPADELSVLQVGATTSGPFTVGFLSAALGQDERTLFNATARLKSQGLLRSYAGDADASFVLSSKILEATVSERLSAAERRELHRRVAEVLELLHPGKPDKLIHDLAHHYAQAGIEDRAYGYSLRAGARARENRLNEQALGCYEAALAFSAQARSARERVELLERVGELREATGKYPEAVDAYSRGMAIVTADPELSQDKTLMSRFLRKLGLVQQKRGQHHQALDSFNQALLMQSDRATPLYIDILSDLGWSYIGVGGFGRAEQLLSDALRLAESLKDRMPAVSGRLSARSFYNLGVLAWSRGDSVLSQQLVERGLETYEAIGDNHSAGEASQLLATLWWRRGEIARAREHYQRFLSQQRRSGEVDFLLRSLQGLGIICQEEGHWTEANDYFAEALNLAERIGNRAATADLNSNLGMTCDERGDWDQALAFYRRALELQPPASADSYGRRVVVMANLAQLLTGRGEMSDAERLLTEAEALAAQNPNPDLRFVLGVCRIQFLLRAGRIEPARKAIVDTLLPVRRERAPRRLAQLYTLASEQRLATGDFLRAAEDARRALGYCGDHTTSKEYAIALRFSGLAKCMLERADRGTREIRRSIELLRDIGSRHELALSLMASALALTRHSRGEMPVDLNIPLSFRPVAEQDVSEALANLREAQAILRLIGARPDAQRADELLETVNHVSSTMRLKARGREEYLKVFYEVSRLIGLGLEKEDFLEHVLDSVINVIQAERGLLFLMQRGKLVPAAARNVDHTTIEDATAISRSVLRRVRRHGEMVLSSDAMTDPRFNTSNSVLLNKIHSLLCVPLTVENRVIGTIYVDSRVTSHLFLEEDMNLLISVASLLAATIDKSAAFKKLQEDMLALREDMLVDAATGYFLGRSRAMKEVYRVIDRIAPSSCTVLLTGETGTGKGVLARLIHAKSERHAQGFMSINCGALPENLFESELFGHARGAFTGAVRDKEGLFEAAVGGTVFLDEVSNTTLGVQAKLLQVLDEKVTRRVGETKPRQVDVRLICATNRDIQQEVQTGRFREDLFYRINGVTINVPALRERTGDVELLATYFVKRYAGQLNKAVDGFEDAVLESFAGYAWPGNVRELQNVVERSVIMAQKNLITTDDVGTQFSEVEKRPDSGRAQRRRLGREEIVKALRETGGNVSQAAYVLAIHRRQLQRLLQRHQIDRTNPY